MTQNLRKLIMLHEGFRSKPYTCTSGKLTICYGRNLDDVGISEIEGAFMLTNDLLRVQKEAIDNLSWFKSISLVRQDVVLSMLIQMGLTTFKTFKKFNEAMYYQNYEKAALEMEQSLWAKQTPKRVQDLAYMMRLGVYPPNLFK